MTDPSQRAFLGSAALLFGGSAAVTMLWCGSMASTGGMEMPGDWTMSMAWMRMPGQSWEGAGGTFVGMWGVMMVAMMLPSLVPMLMRYRRGVASTGETRLFRLTMLVALGYFAVWTALGVMVFPVGATLVSLTMEVPAVARAVPVASALVVLVAGALQFSGWKARQLACCRGMSGLVGVPGVRDVRSGGVRGVRPVGVPRVPDIRPVSLSGVQEFRRVGVPGMPKLRRIGVAGMTDFPGFGGPQSLDMGAAWRYGVRLGLHCTCCCAGLTAILLVMGVMDWRAMAIVAAAITLERLAAAAHRVARLMGAVIVAAGLAWMARAVGLV